MVNGECLNVECLNVLHLPIPFNIQHLTLNISPKLGVLLNMETFDKGKNNGD